jgi:hypothetical protein
VPLERVEEKWKPVFRPHPAQTFGIDHDDFGLVQSKIIVIYSLFASQNTLMRSVISHGCRQGFALSHFPDASRVAPRRVTHRPANWLMAPIRPGKYGEIGFTRRISRQGRPTGLYGSGRDSLLIPDA